MDLAALIAAFATGLVVGAVAVGRWRPRVGSRSSAAGSRAERLRRIDATEAHVTTTLAWLFERAYERHPPLTDFDREVPGARYGQVEVRLLSAENAREYARLCRQLWSMHASGSAGEAAERMIDFRARLREQLDTQRSLAERGEVASRLPDDVAQVASEMLDEVMQFRGEQVAAELAARGRGLGR